MIKLSDRLQWVFDMVDRCSCVADVGCDHGYLSIALVQAGTCQTAIAMDINKGPLMRAEQNIREAGLSEKIETRLSDGLQKLGEGEAEAICICGMGGKLMARIIEENLPVAKATRFLVVEPQSEFYEFRKVLMENGFVIDEEKMCQEENKYYPIIKTHFEQDEAKRVAYDEVELTYGPCLINGVNTIFSNYLDKEFSEFTDIIKNLEGATGDGASKRKKELEHKLDIIAKAR